MTKGLTIRPFDKALHDCGTFSCGVKDMDTWLRECASDQVKKDKIRLWGATNTDGVFIGYYAICTHSVNSTGGHRFPTIYLVALAVDEKYQSHQIGRVLLIDVIRRAVAVSDLVGSMAIILDVKQDEKFNRSRAFYEDAGFVGFCKEEPQRMMIPIKKARKLFM
jgi:GNAT superfamily N-acetyltransferase